MHQYFPYFQKGVQLDIQNLNFNFVESQIENILTIVLIFLIIEMTKESTKDKKKCTKKGKVMLTYGVIQLGSSFVSAIALAAIALGFCSIKSQSKIFNECVEEFKVSGANISAAVHYCN